MDFDDAQRKALMDFVKSGRGIIGIHAASDNFYDWPEAVEMLGGQFNGHPWVGNGWGRQESDGWSFKVDDPDHVLNRAFDGKGFVLKDEIYQIQGPYSRDTHRVLLSLDMSKPHKLEAIKGKKKGAVVERTQGRRQSRFLDQALREGARLLLLDRPPQGNLLEQDHPDALPGRHPMGTGRLAGRRYALRQTHQSAQSGARAGVDRKGEGEKGRKGEGRSAKGIYLTQRRKGAKAKESHFSPSRLA